MKEEEIEAIKKLSGKKNGTTWNDTIRQIKREEITDVVITRQKYITTLLNLIEKQQKELEQEKEKNKHITKETIEFVNSHYIHKDIHKDKINELLKEIQEEKEKNKEYEKELKKIREKLSVIADNEYNKYKKSTTTFVNICGIEADIDILLKEK